MENRNRYRRLSDMRGNGHSSVSGSANFHRPDTKIKGNKNPADPYNMLKSGGKIRWKTDADKVCLSSSFERRGWHRVSEGEPWNIYWASVSSAKMVFNGEFGYRLCDGQMINHFPNHYELTRKDMMVKNVKRYRKEMEREGIYIQDFLPQTYVLPVDYAIFVEEFKRSPQSTWIMKPTSKARGVGIFLVSKLSQVKKWAANSHSTNSSAEVYIISRYIERPLLIGGKKFDLRMYVLVTSYRPLKVFLYNEGFARFCNSKYSTDASDMGNRFVHLTNVSIQKLDEDYNDNHGNKWSIKNLNLYLYAKFGGHAVRQLWNDIEEMVIHSCKAVQKVMMNDKHCFECYGYDVIIDENLKPWLVEVNASPALTATTKSDSIMKNDLLYEIFSLLVPKKNASEESKGPETNTISEPTNFKLLYDGSLANADANETKHRTKNRQPNWR